MVTTPGKSKLPSAAEPLKKMRKMEPAELATNASSNPKYVADPKRAAKDIANPDRDAKFAMPTKVSQGDIRDQSFKYGGGRSAGNRSIADNMARKVLEP